MHFLCRFFIFLALSSVAQSAIIIADLLPENGSTVCSEDGSLTFSATVTETTTFIRNVDLDLRANGKRQYNPYRTMNQVSGTNRYEYHANDLLEGVGYCFRVRGENKGNKEAWSDFSCFTIGDTPVPSSSPTMDLSAAPTPYPSTSPTPAPSSMPSSVYFPTTSSLPSLSPTTLDDTENISYGLQPDCFVEDPTKFSICLDLTSASGEVEPFMFHFLGARETWENVIVSNGIYYTNTHLLDTGFTATGSYPSVIDGVYIASFTPDIDGEGGVLGAAGPVYIIWDGALWRSLTGVMFFDTADIGRMDERGILGDVIEHEMGHVLGIGTLWVRDMLVNYPDSNLYFGYNVLREWLSQGCELVGRGAPILELDGGPGTAGSHFDEACFDRELMTGFADESMILSNLSLGTLADMGYDVDYSRAEEFDLTGPCCSSRRHLDTPSVMEFPKRRLSAENEEKAIKYGKSILEMIHQNLQLLGHDPDVSIADTIIVYIEQDGQVFDIKVDIDSSNIFGHTNDIP